MMWWLVAYMYVSGVIICGVHFETQARTYELLRNKPRTKVEGAFLFAMLVCWPIIPIISTLIAIKQLLKGKNNV